MLFSFDFQCCVFVSFYIVALLPFVFLLSFLCFRNFVGCFGLRLLSSFWRFYLFVYFCLYFVELLLVLTFVRCFWFAMR